MRITALHLMAYGHFTDRSLTLGETARLHVVYGHNEAGKSTTLRALSSVLFGFPHAVVDGFRHGTKDIAIGADLCSAGGRTLSFVRRRRGRALTAADGAQLPAGAVEEFLGGVSQEVFEKVFALDHHRLRAHARALLADGGSLGFGLAEAGSGVAGLKAVLDRFKGERDQLFLGRGTKPTLNHAIAELVELRKQARQSAVSPSDYRNHEKGLRDADAALSAARGRRQDIEAGIARLERIGRNLPLRAQHRAVTADLAALDGVPLLAPEFAETRIRATSDRDRARTDIADASAEIADIEQRIAGIAVDAEILACSEEIEAAAARRPAIEKHDTEAPRAEAERAGLLARAAALMAGAELGDDGRPLEVRLAADLPPPHRRKLVQSLAGEGRALLVKRAAAREEAEDAGAKLAPARQRAEAMAPPRAADELLRALTAADRLGAGITTEMAQRHRALERRTTALADTLTSLGVGCSAVDAGLAGGIARLRGLVVPPEKTEARYGERLAGIEAGIKDAKQGIGRLNGEIADRDARIAELRGEGEVATEDDVSAAREARDRGWTLVRGLYVDGVAGLDDAARRFAPDGDVAGAFAARVHDADRAVDLVRSRVDESTEVRLLGQQTIALNAERDGLIETVARLQAERDTALSEWRALWPPGVITLQAPGEMAEWLGRRSAVLQQAEEVEQERDAVAAAVTRAGEVSRALAAAMAAFTGEAHDGDVDALRDRARIILDAASEARRRHDDAAAALRTLSERNAESDRKAARLDAQVSEWRQSWHGALAQAGLAPGLTVEAATAALEVIAEVEGVKSAIAAVDGRLAAAAVERDAFAAAVAGITARLTAAPEGPAATVCRGLEARLVRARDAAQEREAQAVRLGARAADRTRAGDRLAGADAVLAELCAQAGGVAAGELAEIERRSTARRDALRERERIETRVREDGDGRDFGELFAECDGIDRDRAVARLQALRAGRDDAEAEVEKLMKQRVDLQAEFDRLLGDREAADVAQEAAAVQAGVADGVEEYVNLTVQETLLRAAIELYRDRNQGPILRRARDLFVQLTGGAYSGLRADLENGETVLLVEDPARGSLELDALSDGTVDAVYLALRLAVVQEHNATREPLPFIADDLLLNLDNRRAEAALRTLAEVAKSGQVLLFTHHAHMLELARRAVPPDILVEHDLSASSQVGVPVERRRAG